MRKPPSGKEIRILKVRAAKLERMIRKHNNSKRQNKRRKTETFRRNKPFRELAKNVCNYSDVINLFMPKNLRYLISYDKSPIYLKTVTASKSVPVIVVHLPQKFSILDNPDETYAKVKRIVEILVCQKCRELWIDYIECSYSDLLTQIFLDSILKDWDKFVNICIRANLLRYIKVRSIGGRNYDSLAIQRMVNSVGSPTILLKRQFDYNQIIPFTLRYFDQEDESIKQLGASNEVDTTHLLEYVNQCLNRIGKELTDDAASALGTVIGETVINASEHSTMKSRYLIGYFEELSTGDNINTHGILNLVILNYGQSIYEKFKDPLNPESVNSEAITQMQQLSDLYTKKGFFSSSEFKESTLWTLYALQQGVTIIPNANRGNGTVQFIDKFFDLRESDEKNESRMYLLSGNTIIEFDGSYELTNISDENGNNRAIMAFNKIGSLREKPDANYVRHTKYFFPGTAIFARITLNSNIIKNETN